MGSIAMQLVCMLSAPAAALWWWCICERVTGLCECRTAAHAEFGRAVAAIIKFVFGIGVSN